ncbi:unnamed protein product [Brugia timori]|uniref:Uncharacterized protein n=1 Tax=Brugia timori TaxID=42155 RepID=A0A0R3Q903_9BILA|nr:unnamed protein product [Brugia timori]
MYARFLDVSFSLRFIEIPCGPTCNTIPCTAVGISPPATLLVMILAPSPLPLPEVTTSCCNRACIISPEEDWLTVLLCNCSLVVDTGVLRCASCSSILPTTVTSCFVSPNFSI